MYYGAIKKCDIANGVGVRVSLFVSGCTNHCEECFNKETWDFCYGQPFTPKTKEYILELLKPDYVDGFSLLGGEPFEPQNQQEILPLLIEIKKQYPNKTIWVYTGFLFDKELLASGTYAHTDITREILSHIDVLVDGRFVNALKNLKLKFRGSSNQRIIDVKKSLALGKVVKLEVDEFGKLFEIEN